MRYMLLAYTRQDWSEVDFGSPEFLAMTRFYDELGAELTTTGELLATEGLADPRLTRTVRPVDGGAEIGDGPYADVPLALTSFSVLDVADATRAEEIAARITRGTGDTVEIRPLGTDPAPEGSAG